MKDGIKKKTKSFEEWSNKEVVKSFLRARAKYKPDGVRVAFRHKREVVFVFQDEIKEDDRSWIDWWLEYGRYNPIDKSWSRSEYSWRHPLQKITLP